MVRVSELDEPLANAWKDGQLSVIGTGSESPCLDLRRLNEDCATICSTADLIILEVMLPRVASLIHTTTN